MNAKGLLKWFWDHRSEILEIVIIGLIAWEIKIAVRGLRETDGQLELLQKMNANTTVQARHLKSLLDQQGIAIAAQQDALRSQVAAANTLGSVNAALQRQLRILKANQERREAEAARKPNLQLTVGGVAVASEGERITALELTATRAVYQLRILNNGSRGARGIVLRVFTSKKDVHLDASMPSGTIEVPADGKGSAIAISIGRLQEKSWAVTTLTFDYPKGVGPFDVGFNADADDLPVVVLGELKVTPP